ncbi:MAG: hypothetical protein WAT21_11000 [Saprospiraceae bacterium]|nr:hypothetical protein [Candidatus Vicinibacter affinis]
MTKPYIFLLIICLTFSCKEKQNIKGIKVENLEVPPPPPPKIIDKNSLIGFACYSSGSKSKPVTRISEILKSKEYTTIKEKLFDVNIGEKYLATIACERLEQKGLIKLNEKEIYQIKENKISSEKLTICAGCTKEEELTMQELFSKNKNFLSESTEDWLIEMIK